MPDWLSGLDVPDVSDEDVEAARQSIPGASDDDAGAWLDSSEDEDVTKR